MRTAALLLLPALLFACNPDGPDDDGDGQGVNTDCNDGDPAVNTDAPETCNGIDDNCDGIVDESFDFDGDGVRRCDEDVDDCDDTDASVFPGADELCNGVDDNCDGLADEGFDNDGDGQTTCEGDCDDNDDRVAADIDEVCDAIDNDCDGAVDEIFDGDLDGVTLCGPDGTLGTADDDCWDLDPTVGPGFDELCDELDNDCDGLPGLDEFDFDGDGWPECYGDCDDDNPDVFPFNFEFGCNGVDDDCDSETPDSGDDDGDGFDICDGDCFPFDASRYPDAPETCDGFDDDCDGWIDEDFDADFDGQTTCGGDCDDTDRDVYDGAPELCDTLDNDCDGAKDEDFSSDLDGDTIIDCLDSERTDADCADGVDNDGDTFVDCAAPDCVGVGSCPNDEVCFNLVDDDSDGLPDCFDDDCYDTIHCECTVLDELDCTTTTSIYGELWGGSTTDDSYAYDCGGSLYAGLQPEQIFEFTAPYDGLFEFELASHNAELDWYVLEGINGCQPDSCLAADSVPAGFARPWGWFVDQDEQILIAVENADSFELGAFTLSITECTESLPEVCDDFIDNDLDGATDCNDSDCSGDASCPQECVAGEQVVGCFTSLSDTTFGLPTDMTSHSCMPWNMSGPERTYHFANTSGVTQTVQITVDATFDQGIILTDDPNGCSQDPTACIDYADDEIGADIEILTVSVPGGQDRWIIIDGWGGDEGDYDLQIDCF